MARNQKKMEHHLNAESVQTHFIKTGKINFAYRIIGDGFPVVLFHRFRATIDEWDPAFINQLGRKNKVIIFDNVGIGLTEGNTPQTIEEIVADAFRFTQALQLKSFNILGWSIGGLVAQVFAMNYKTHVLKLVLVATGPAASGETIFPNDQFLETSRHDENPPEDHQVLFFTKDEDGYKETLKSLGRMKRRMSSPIPATKKENWVAQSVAAKDFFYNKEGYFNRLKEVTQPVLIGGAKGDIAFPMIDSYLLAREMPNSRLIIYSNAGHGFQHQYYSHFGNMINQFLSDKTFF